MGKRLFNKINIFMLFFAFSSLQAYSATITFAGQLDLIDVDNGGIYSGTSIGTNFSGFIDDITANGEISNGTTVTAFGCCIAAGGLSVSNNEVLDSDDAALLNSLAGSTIFTAGDLIDVVNIEGDSSVAGGGRIEIGLSYVFDGSTFSDSSPDNYPFDPNVVLVALFFILEEDAMGEDVYSVLGQLDAVRLPAPLITWQQLLLD